MDLFINIKDTKLNQDLKVNIQHIKNYKISTTQTNTIIYNLDHNIQLQEEFTSSEDMQSKLDTLNGLTL